MKKKLFIAPLLSILALFLCGAYWLKPFDKITTLIVNTLVVEGAATLSGANTISGATDFTGQLTVSSRFILTEDAVSLTSPTTTISLVGRGYIELNSDANVTGVTFTNGSVGQVVIIVTGAGSNTIRFDDNGVDLALGGNITLTEGQADSLTIICTATDKYAAIAAHDN